MPFGYSQPWYNTYHGCWFFFEHTKKYLPQVKLASATTIRSTTSRTNLTQTFCNPQNVALDEVQYSFPLYDGVSLVAFKCTVGDRTITGVVKEKHQARSDYKAAVDRGETAGLLEQAPEAADVFTTKIGNVPAGSKVVVEITYLGELKNDAETDGARFTIPTSIASRYGSITSDSEHLVRGPTALADEGMSILVDVMLEDGAAVRGIQSPSHPIAVTVGHTSETVDDEDTFSSSHGSATLTLGKTELDTDFVIVIQAKGQDTPRATLETHPTFPNQRAIMTTLVPKFNLPNIHPEVVFVVDRSGSMQGNMHLVINALKVFLKSLPIGIKFNICSFGTNFDFLFKKSKTYDESSLKEAMSYLNPATFSSNYGGTETLKAVKGTVERRFKDLPLEIMLLTDGDIWDQQSMFDFINKASKDNTRVFTLGIGSGVSSSLVEGVARAGNGFSQSVQDGEKIDKRVVRMLKGALTPHITDYKLEVKYEAPEKTTDSEDFELIESFEKSMVGIGTETNSPSKKFFNAISLFNPSAKDEPTNPPAGRYDHLPAIEVPNVLQAPHQIAGIYPHERTTIYLLLGPGSNPAKPTSIVLRGTSPQGPLELEIPIQDVGQGETIHQMAAKKAVHEVEEGRGWITQAKNKNGALLQSKHAGHWDMIVEREAVRLGVQYQVGGKFCSFVAVEKNAKEDDEMTLCEKEPVAPTEGSEHGKRRKSRGGFARYASHSATSNTWWSSNQQQQTPSSMPAPTGQNAIKMFSLPTYATGPGTVPGGALFGRQAPPLPAARSMRGGPVFGGVDEAKDATKAGSSVSLFGRSAGFGGGHDRKESASPRQRLASKAARPSPPSSAVPPPPPAPSEGAMSYDCMTLEAAAPCALPDDLEEEADEDMCFDDIVVENMSTCAMQPAPPALAKSMDRESAQSPAKKRKSGHQLTPEEKMHLIIELQTFSGSWQMTKELLGLLGFKDKKEVIEHAAFKDVGDANTKDAENIFATCAVVAWLEKHVPNERDVYEMVADKARDWMRSKGVDADDLVGKAKKLW